MKNKIIRNLIGEFEEFSHTTESGIEFWFARELQLLLDYTEWRNFSKVIVKAKTACEVSGHNSSDHFVEVNKMVTLVSGSKRNILEEFINV